MTRQVTNLPSSSPSPVVDIEDLGNGTEAEFAEHALLRRQILAGQSLHVFLVVLV
jgi:hypothetical protein